MMPQHIHSNIAFINHIHLHYLSKGSGKLMLFLHGFPEFSYAWKNQLNFFSKDYFVVAPDLRGYHLSDKPEKITMDDLVEDVRGLITFFGYQECILVGHDWGGMIGMIFAARYPRQVEKLILLNATHPALFQEALENNADQQKASSYIAMLRNSRAERIIQSHHYHYFWDYLLAELTEKKIFSENDKKHYEAAWDQEGALTGMLAYYRQWPLGMNVDLLKTLSVSSETLLIWGEKDRCLTKTLALSLKNIIKNVMLEFIPEGSHWIHHEFPGKINRIIKSTLINKN